MPLCTPCADLCWRWLDSKPSEVLDVRLSFTYGSGTPYDASAAGVADGQRARFERWRTLVRTQQTAIRVACAAGRHVASHSPNPLTTQDRST